MRVVLDELHQPSRRYRKAVVGAMMWCALFLTSNVGSGRLCVSGPERLSKWPRLGGDVGDAADIPDELQQLW